MRKRGERDGVQLLNLSRSYFSLFVGNKTVGVCINEKDHEDTSGI